MTRLSVMEAAERIGSDAIFKRGMRGVYQHCKEKHLHRHLAEYDFRYNHRVTLGYNDGERAALVVKTPLASVSRIGGLTRSDFSAPAKGFMRWRKKHSRT